MDVLLEIGSTVGELELSDEESRPNEGLLGLTDEDVKSETVGFGVDEPEDVDTGTVKLSVSVKFLLLVSGLIICGFSIKTIMQYGSNKHNHFKELNIDLSVKDLSRDLCFEYDQIQWA